MTPHRRFHTFNDHLRSRFGDRVQRVTLSGGLVCSRPGGPEECPYCAAAAGRDPGYGRGFPVHEQIRRAVNFSRRRGETAPLLMVSVPVPAGGCPPADHLRSTLQAASQGGVAVLSVSATPECVSEEIRDVLLDFVSPDREVWLEIEGTPAESPVPRDGRLKIGLQVELDVEDGPGEAAALVCRLKPDAVGLVAPAIRTGTPDAELYDRGELDEPDLEDFAARAAAFLELIPASVAVHPVVLAGPADSIVGPLWVLNRQKVQEAVGLALETRETSQGAACASPAAEER